ncbi:hypothetical protein BLAT2472_10050 [Burkholderia latens]
MFQPSPTAPRVAGVKFLHIQQKGTAF